MGTIIGAGGSITVLDGNTTTVYPNINKLDISGAGVTVTNPTANTIALAITSGSSQSYSLSLASSITAFSPADATTYYFGSGRVPTTVSKDRAVIVPNTGVIKKVGIVTTINTTLASIQDSVLSIRVRSGGINGIPTDTIITSTLKFNATYISTLITGLNINVNEGDAVEMKWLTPTWTTNPVNIFIDTKLFIA